MTEAGNATSLKPQDYALALLDDLMIRFWRSFADQTPSSEPMWMRWRRPA
jgi:hypothetical protein